MAFPYEQIERNVEVKREATTDLMYGCKPDERPVEQLIRCGIVNINKPSGPT